jgi:hypothetical protein
MFARNIMELGAFPYKGVRHPGGSALYQGGSMMREIPQIATGVFVLLAVVVGVEIRSMG